MPDCRNQFFKGTLHTKMNPKSKIRMESIALSINENAQQTKTQLNEKLKKIWPVDLQRQLLEVLATGEKLMI